MFLFDDTDICGNICFVCTIYVGISVRHFVQCIWSAHDKTEIPKKNLSYKDVWKLKESSKWLD